MRRTFLLAMVFGLPLLAADPLASRIGHTDPSKYRRSRSHGSAGDMACETLLPGSALATNLFFMHRCQIMPGGGVGHHFHNTDEEMFVIFDGEAEFTIDGHTSLLKGTVGAPNRMGHSHAIYNPGDKPVEFMNINISAVKGRYDAFNLDDARIGVPKEPIPAFMTMRLDKALLRPMKAYHGGEGTAQYRRALDPIGVLDELVLYGPFVTAAWGVRWEAPSCRGGRDLLRAEWGRGSAGERGNFRHS